jgi:hypothetical protein
MNFNIDENFIKKISHKFNDDEKSKKSIDFLISNHSEDDSS